jgi:hypothetical protein
MNLSTLHFSDNNTSNSIILLVCLPIAAFVLLILSIVLLVKFWSKIKSFCLKEPVQTDNSTIQMKQLEITKI